MPQVVPGSTAVNFLMNDKVSANAGTILEPVFDLVHNVDSTTYAQVW